MYLGKPETVNGTYEDQSGVSASGVLQSLPVCCPVQPALGEPSLACKLD